MKNLKSFILLPVFGWVLFLVACKEDEVIPQLPTFTAEDQLAIYVQDSSSIVSTVSNDGFTYYLKVQDSVAIDTSAIENDDIIYFHYALSFLSVALDSVNENTDSLRIDTLKTRIPLIDFDDLSESVIGKLGSKAIWPVGIETALIESSENLLLNGAAKPGETYTFYLPPSLSYEQVPLNSQLIDQPVEVSIRIDSVGSIDVIKSEALSSIIRYINTTELRDTTQFPGGPVQILTDVFGDPVYFKRLGPPTNGLIPSFINRDSVEFSFSYRFVVDSLLGDIGALERISGSYAFEFGDNSVISGLSTGLRNMRQGERSIVLFTPNSAYKEAICFIPDLRNSAFFYGDREGSTSNRAKQYLVENKIVPSYAFQTEPYRSYIFEVTLDQVY